MLRKRDLVCWKWLVTLCKSAVIWGNAKKRVFRAFFEGSKNKNPVPSPLNAFTNLLKTPYSTIISKLQFALKTGGYEAIVPVFQLSLCLPLDNACCERGFSAMNDIKTAKRNKLDKPLFPLMLLAMHENSFKFNYEKMVVAGAATWTYNDWVV